MRIARSTQSLRRSVELLQRRLVHRWPFIWSQNIFTIIINNYQHCPESIVEFRSYRWIWHVTVFKIIGSRISADTRKSRRICKTATTDRRYNEYRWSLLCNIGCSSYSVVHRSARSAAVNNLFTMTWQDAGRYFLYYIILMDLHF